MKKQTLFILIMAIAAAFIFTTAFSSCNVARSCPTNDPKFFYKHR